MWLIKYLGCLIHKHVPVYVICGNTPYRYCLRCGEVREAHRAAVRDNSR